MALSKPHMTILRKKADCVNIYLWENSRCVDAYATTFRTVYGAWPSDLMKYLIDYVITAPVSMNNDSWTVQGSLVRQYLSEKAPEHRKLQCN
ncbi:hypothetical protein BDV30DRAFT_206638 [Aspergillus minisclerotigenes]|uniref:Uncharacterized protein n=1 Tax=Aspergillus minisclerotigenes TaxID=656917 RepID=A0A5N6JEP7_9EURO|nr:hypothetical protein BDV30DRAFT_206638 [Aspergillus minisclerotigenes]